MEGLPGGQRENRSLGPEGRKQGMDSLKAFQGLISSGIGTLRAVWELEQ